MRYLTGNWYLKKRFWGGFDLMVEIMPVHICNYDFSQFEGDKIYVKAKDSDLIDLKINTV